MRVKQKLMYIMLGGVLVLTCYMLAQKVYHNPQRQSGRSRHELRDYQAFTLYRSESDISETAESASLGDTLLVDEPTANDISPNGGGGELEQSPSFSLTDEDLRLVGSLVGTRTPTGGDPSSATSTANDVSPQVTSQSELDWEDQYFTGQEVKPPDESAEVRSIEFGIRNLFRWYTILDDHQAESIDIRSYKSRGNGSPRSARVVWDDSSVTFIDKARGLDVCRIYDNWDDKKRGFPFEREFNGRITQGIARPTKGHP